MHNQPRSAAQGSQDASKLPMFCFIVAIIDLSMGGLTLLGAPFSLLGIAVLPDESPLHAYIIPGILVMLLIGGSAVLADIAMLKKKPAAILLGYLNIAAMLIGIVYIWVQLPATIESQEMQMAADPNMQNMPPAMGDMMETMAVASVVFATCIRLTMIVLVGMMLMKFKAWLAKQRKAEGLG